MEHTQSVTPKREKLGRWNPAEAQLFEVLVERYGKNWKKIQSFIKGRTLAQVRSHGQKFFERVGSKKTE
jgi:SHAQKYF class myb-like DNA-binding protein